MRKVVEYPIYVGSEFFMLFVLLPVSLALDYSIWIKALLILVGLAYILYYLRAIKPFSGKKINWKEFTKATALKFSIIVLITTIFVYVSNPSVLFYVPLNNFLLYFGIVVLYTVLSVFPQELIYRTFFLNRYGAFFRNKNLLIFVNAVLFSLAHMYFRNILVLLLTFVGGLLFAWTFLKWRSTTLVTLEHALYGNWIFAVGMGEMLAFPGMPD